MFIGRQRELEVLAKELEKKTKSAIIVYGRRRIGKSTLIAQATQNIENTTVVRFKAVPDSIEANSLRLSEALAEAFGIPGLRIANLEAVLKFIISLKGNIILTIDEYQDLRWKNGTLVDAYMRDFIDEAADNLKIIISGSAIRIMKSLLDYDIPLFKRFTLELPLFEMDYLESSLFYPERTVREKIMLYSIFGGTPMLLSMIDKNESVEENMIRLLVSSSGAARTYTEDVLYSELRDAGGCYAAVSRIASGKRTYSQIKASLGGKDAGSLDYTLNKLIKAEFIEKTNPINDQKNRKKTFYSLKSNLLRWACKIVCVNGKCYCKEGDTADDQEKHKGKGCHRPDTRPAGPAWNDAGGAVWCRGTGEEAYSPAAEQGA